MESQKEKTKQMLKKSLSIVITSILTIVVFQLFIFSSKNIQNTLNLQEFYAAKSHTIDPNTNFCGEPIPLQSEDVVERLDKELLKNAYWHSEMILYYKRAGKFFPIIEPILKKNNIPDDFKYLAIIESGLTNVSSPAGAAGFWQIMEKTGQEYGLEVNNEVDERYNLEKSTQAACDYLNAAYKRFGSWTLVAASYNMGMGGVAKKLTQQKVDNYFDLLLNVETARYVYRIIAVKEILSKPFKFGYNLSPEVQYKPMTVKKLTVDTTILDLNAFALEQGINIKLLKIANPWLRVYHLPNSSRKSYEIQIPTSNYMTIPDYTCNTDSAKNFTDSLHKILCSDSIPQLKTDTISLKNSVNSDSIAKPKKIGKPKK